VPARKIVIDDICWPCTLDNYWRDVVEAIPSKHRTVRNTSENALVGWCAANRKAGFKIGCAVDFRVDHP